MELKLDAIYIKAKSNIEYIKNNKQIFSTVKDKDIVERIIKEHLFVINKVDNSEYIKIKEELFSDINIDNSFLESSKSLIDMSDEINYFDFYLKNVFKIDDQSKVENNSSSEKNTESLYNTKATGTSQINPAAAFNSILSPGKNSVRSPEYYPFTTKPKWNWYLRIAIYIVISIILAANIARIIMTSTFSSSVSEIKVDNKVYNLGFLGSDGLFNFFIFFIFVTAPFSFFKFKKYDRFKYHTSNQEASSWFLGTTLTLIKLFFYSSTTLYWYFNELSSILDVDQANVIRSLFTVDVIILSLVLLLFILTVISKYLNPKVDTGRVRNDTMKEIEEMSKKINGGF